MSVIYICEDTEHDMDSFLAVNREGVLSGLESLCGGHLDYLYESGDGNLDVYWKDSLDERFNIRCTIQTEIYGDKEALDQLKVVV